MSSSFQPPQMQINQACIEQTMQYLKDSFSQKDDKLVKQATKELEQLSKNFETHLQTLLQIISLPPQQCSNDIKQSAAIYIKNSLQANISRFDETQLKQMLSMFINLVLDCPNLKSTKSLNSIVTKIILDLLTSKLLIETNTPIKDMFLHFTQTLKTATQDVYVTKCKDIFTMISCMFQSKAIIHHHVLICIQGLFTLIDDVVGKMNIYINVANTSNQIDFAFVEMLFEMFDTINTAILHSKNDIPPSELSASLFQRFGKVFYELITLSIMNTNAHNFEGSVMYFTADYKLNKYINNLKAKVIQTMTWIVQLGGDEIKNQDLLNVVTSLLETFIKTLDFGIKNYINDIHKEFDYVNDYSLNPNIKSNGYCNVLYNLIAFFVRVLVREPIKTKFMPLIENFLGNIVYPLIVPPETDSGLIKVDGEAYCQFFDDMVNIQQFKNFRAATVFLFKKLREKIPDLSGYALCFVIEMLSVLLISKGDANNIEQLNQSGKYPRYFKSKRENHSIHLFPIENQIQFCNIVLSTYDEYLQQNKNFTNAVKSLFINQMTTLHSTTSIQVQDSLCFIYEKFISNLFNEELYSDIQSVSFLSSVFDFLLSSSLKKDYPGLSCHATQALITILDYNEKYLPTIQMLLNEKFALFIELINESEIMNYFTLMSTLVSDIQIENKDLLFHFLELVVKRLLREIGTSSGNKESYINACFDIIRNVLTGNNKDTIKERENAFESMVTPIVNYVQNPKKIIFEDGIITLVYNYIKLINHHSSLSFLILKHMDNICVINNKLPDEAFDFLIQFIIIDIQTNNSQFIIQNLPSIIKLITLPQTNQFNDPTSMKYALLLALKLISLNLTANPTIIECFTQVINVYHDCFDNNLDNDDNYSDDEDKLSAKCINYTLVAFISMFIFSYPETAVEFLISSQNNKLDSYIHYIRELHNSKNDYYYKDFSKCQILALCALLTNENAFGIIKNKLNVLHLINLLFDLVCRQKKEETKHFKEKMKNEVDCNFVEEDEDEERNMNSRGFSLDNLEDEEDIEELIEKCDFSYVNIDEFECFTKCLHHVEQQQNDFFKQFINQLSDIKKYALNEIIHVRKLKVTYENKTLYIPRRAVKIKRKNLQNETQQ